MPFLPAALSVTAKTMAMWACLPVVMNCLTPLSTKVAVAVGAGGDGAEASEPVCGSVRQKQPSFSPRASGLSHSSFCASVPYFMVMPQASEFCTETMVEVAPSPAAISSSVSTSDM
jgi:hypothetical protein